MTRGIRSTLALVLAIAAQGMPAHAQYDRYSLPRGYEGYGFGGWGGGGGAGSTVQGSIASGLGALAVGAGAYNEQTAQANAINSQTLMQWNQYLYLSQQESNRRYHTRMAQGQKGIAQSRDQIYKRLHDNPTPSDITKGDALNVAFDEVTAPNVYLRGTKGTEAKLPGPMVRDIPFQYASAAITTSVFQLTKGGPPPSLKNPVFEDDRQALRKIADEIRTQEEEKGAIDPALIDKAQVILKSLWEKVKATYPKNSRDRNEAEKRVKALYGLSEMLKTPAINLLVAGVEKHPEATLGELLSFMKAFNLRFGVATTTRQKQVYQTLYPLLAQLRDEVNAAPQGKPPVAATTPEAPHPGEFLSGMKFEKLEPKSTPAPPAPKPE
jgi:hypothetical protein